MGIFFSKLKALWDQGLRGRGSKMIKKHERRQEKLTGLMAKPCSIRLVTYTATTKIRKYSFENEQTKEEERAMRLLDQL